MNESGATLIGILARQAFSALACAGGMYVMLQWSGWSTGHLGTLTVSVVSGVMLSLVPGGIWTAVYVMSAGAEEGWD